MTGPGLRATKRQRKKQQFQGLTQAFREERDILSGVLQEHLVLGPILQMRKLRPQEGELLAHLRAEN